MKTEKENADENLNTGYQSSSTSYTERIGLSLSASTKSSMCPTKEDLPGPVQPQPLQQGD